MPLINARQLKTKSVLKIGNLENWAKSHIPFLSVILAFVYEMKNEMKLMVAILKILLIKVHTKIGGILLRVHLKKKHVSLCNKVSKNMCREHEDSSES